MNTLFLLRKNALWIISVTIMIGINTATFAQGGPLWQPLGSDTVQTFRNVKINKALTVLQKIIAKEIIAQKVTADTIRATKALKVGENSFTFLPNVFCPTSPVPTDEILSDNGQIAFGSNAPLQPLKRNSHPCNSR